jgi:DNA polymerase III subunit delta'
VSNAAAEYLWHEVVGQDEAVRQLRAAVEAPVHAYLIVGPEGSGKRAAARAFAADLLSRGHDDDGSERARQLAGAEAHPSMFVVERDGASIATDQAREIVRQSGLAPPEGDLQVIVLVDFHLIGVAAPRLLKSIEEPPATTVFVILAEEVPPELITIASRCVRIDLTAVPHSALVERLLEDGIEPEVAATAAAGAGGSLSRARLLARDPAAGSRRDGWYRAPERLDGSGSAACATADELLASIDGVIEPLEEQQSEEMAAFLASFEAAGVQLRKGDLKKLEDRHKREQRRVRTDELRSGLGVLVSRYRDSLAHGGSAEEFLTAADAVQELCDNLVFNPRESLALQALFVQLPPLRPSH